MSSSRRLSILFAAIAIVLLGSFVVLFGVGAFTIYENSLVQTHQLIAAELGESVGALRDAQARQLEYVLTGDPGALEAFDAAVFNVNHEMEALAARTHPSGRGGRRQLDPTAVKSLSDLAGNEIAGLRAGIDLRRNSGLAAATANISERADQRKIDEIAGVVSRMVAHEKEEVKAARDAGTRSVTARVRLFLVIFLLNAGLLAWTYRRIRREGTARQAALTDVERQKDLLAVTLGSIGDAVIVSDPQARITYMNEVAEKLTGWKLAEAQGKACAAVFRIINEETREAVESPIDKVLQQGVTVGLANHTLLIRKDGAELPIDDSGAPIRDRDGTVRGVVLIFRDFSEHKEAERILRAAKQELETAGRAKDHFLASLSHELRTPLTPVLATLTSWDAEGKVPQELLADVQMMRRNVELEARLIDDLLDLTRIAQGKMALHLEVSDLHKLIHATLKVCDGEIAVRRIRVSLKCNAPRHHAKVDPGRIQQVLWNVLKNATKFAAEGGLICIETRNPSEGQVEVAIRDDGIGMSRQTVDRVFRPFEQGADEINKRFGGLGLGMAISKALMDAQNGLIIAESAGLGEGSTFRITLPVAAPARAEVAPRSVPSPPANSSRRQLKILLVEDHKDTADVLGRVLRGRGHEVEIRDTVASAVSAIQSQGFDLLLSDIGLPDGTGIDLMTRVRSHYNLPAIALTGYGMEDDVERCREAGFGGHLTKPVSFEKLDAMIGKIAMAGAD